MKTFLQRKIYANHPDEFNDIYDCNTQLIIFDDETYNKEFIQPIIEKENLTTDFVAIVSKEFLYKMVGILSLTTKPNDLLLWSYYNNHKGFVVEFDYLQFPFKNYGPFPINYQSEIEKISMNEYKFGLSFLYQTNIKSTIWDHEDEWRIIIDSVDEHMKVPKTKHRSFQILGGKEREFSFPVDAIKSVWLGARFFNTELYEIISDDGKHFKIRIEDPTDIRIPFLNFLLKNRIHIKLGLQSNDLISLIFLPCKLKKTGDTDFIFTAISQAKK